jgi:hypothetical protein
VSTKEKLARKLANPQSDANYLVDILVVLDTLEKRVELLVGVLVARDKLGRADADEVVLELVKEARSSVAEYVEDHVSPVTRKAVYALYAAEPLDHAA